MMNKHILFAALTLCAATGVQAQATPLANESQDTVTWQQPIQLDANLLKGLQPAGFKTQSTSFHLDATGAELSQGLDLQLSGADAVVMLNRLDGQKAGDVEARLLFAGQPSKHVQTVADAEALKATGWLAGQNLAMKLGPDAPAGVYQLQLPKAAAQSRWVVSVQDRNSPWTLSASVDKQAVMSGETVTLHARWQGNAKLETVQGFLIRPDGQPDQQLAFKQQPDGNWMAQFPAPVSAQPGLWDVQILTQGATEKGPLLRDARLAFASAQASAKLKGMPQLQQGAGLLQVQVEVEKAGRYALHALLLKGEGEGLKVEQARWLEPGLHTLNIPVQNAGSKARLLAIRLQDQSRLADLGQLLLMDPVETSNL